jgi:glycosyltransferase involved in cell wall biosynthesis
MRVLHVFASLDQSYGGPLLATLDLAAHSQTPAFQNEVLGFGPQWIPDNPLPQDLFHSLPGGAWHTYCYSRLLRKWLGDNLGRFDGVVLHGMWLYPYWAVARSCQEAAKLYVCFPHGMLEPWSVFRQGWMNAAKKVLYWKAREERIFRNGECALFTTQRELRLAQPWLAPLGVRCMVVPYGIAASRCAEEGPDNDSLRLPAGLKVALFLGRVHRGKNVAFLIRAWAGASPAADWVLVIAGPAEPRYLAELRELARELRVSHQTRFVGMVTGRDKAYLFRRAHWFLLPSQHENFGNAALEAIQYECPVVLSDQVYLMEFLHPASEVLPLSERVWIEFFRDRMEDEHHRQHIIEQDRLHVRPRFDIGQVAKGWADALVTIFRRRP